MRSFSNTNRVRAILFCSFALAAMAFSRPAAAGPSAPPPAPFLTGAGTNLASNGAFTLGYQVIVGNSPVELDSLGLWDDGSDGLSASHAVGIWGSDHSTPLAQVAVPAGTGASLIDGYRFVALSTPIDLSANTIYVLGAAYNSNEIARDITAFDSPSANALASPGVSIGKGEFEFGSTLPYPSGDVSTIYNGPNGLFIVVPEPASLGLLLLIAGAGRRRRK